MPDLAVLHVCEIKCICLLVAYTAADSSSSVLNSFLDSNGVLSEEQRAEVWDDISDSLSSLLQEGHSQESMPFDASSSNDMDQQR